MIYFTFPKTKEQQMISPRTKQRLIRYATAQQHYEFEKVRLYDSDGGYREIAPKTKTIDEYLSARADLMNCSEVRALVHRIQIERIDTAMKQSELAARKADDDALIANNELVALGHKYKAEQETKIQPHRRRRDVRRKRSRTNRRRRS
jgi:hypothetical protein